MMDQNVECLLYSNEAAATRAFFYSDLNDINLYVEDADKQYEYESIFKRLLGDKYTIQTIFPLGGKPNVIKRYKELGSITNGVRNIFLVDGDFDQLIHPEQMVQDDCFIYLETYNIENYYIDENACYTFAKGHLKQIDSIVKQTIKFQEWLNRIVAEAKNLFLDYCLVQKNNVEEKTISRSPYEFIDSQTGFQRQDRSFEVYNSHVLSLCPNAQEELDQIKHNYEEINGSNYFNLICGKFLLTSLRCYLLHAIKEVNPKARIDMDDLKWYLICSFDISKLEYIKHRIENLK